MDFGNEAITFLRAASKHDVRMLLIGGGAVNFHGYQRQSADIDLWFEPTAENFDRLVGALREAGYDIDAIPDQVLRAEQNITLKMSPGLDVELITFLRPGCTFDEAWGRSEFAELAGEPVMRYRVMSLPDLIESKQRAARPKDLLDIQELKRRRK